MPGELGYVDFEQGALSLENYLSFMSDRIGVKVGWDISLHCRHQTTDQDVV